MYYLGLELISFVATLSMNSENEISIVFPVSLYTLGTIGFGTTAYENRYLITIVKIKYFDELLIYHNGFRMEKLILFRTR